MNKFKLQLFAACCAASLAIAGTAIAEDHDDDDEDSDEVEFAETEIFFELNNTDGDLGIHSLIDGDGWKRLIMTDPNERKMLNVHVKGRLRRQGLTEFFFESAEPTFDELHPTTFFKRFPAGEYEVEGRRLDGAEMDGETELTHVMPAPPVARVNGEDMDTDCDDDTFTVVDGGATISWDPVTMSHPDPNGGGAGVQPPVPVEIYNYQLVVEAEVEVDGEEFDSIFSIILPPDITSVTLPDALFELDTDEFKYEVLARETSFNQTAVESCFILAAAED